MKAAVFDMDGLLIDSEPLWQEVEKSLFQSLGIDLTDNLCAETTGMRVDEVVQHWFERFPWEEPSCEQVTQRLIDSATGAILSRGSLMRGALEVVEGLHEQGLVLAIASSSPSRLIRAVVSQFSMAKYFSVIHSAEDEVNGKPHPAVYQTTIRRLGVPASDCIAFEDSISGVLSAKTAGLSVIAVPALSEISRPEFQIADAILPSLSDFSLAQLL